LSPRTRWWTPAQALEHAVKIVGRAAGSAALLDRIKGGRIRVGAATFSDQIGDEPPELFDEPETIPANHWRDVTSLYRSNFWHGDFEFSLRTGGGYGKPMTVRCYGIRLDPDGVRASLPLPTPATPEPPAVSLAKPPDADEAKDTPAPQRGPPVSPAALRAWHEAYKLAYTGTPQDKLETAYLSAAGAFPGKSVSRDAIRALVGGRKPGPKGPRQS